MHDSFPTLFASVDVIEKVITDFQDAWKRGEPSKLTTFFAQLEGEAPQVRESVQLLLILQDQSLRWQMWRRQRESSAETNGKPDTLTEHTDRAPLLEDYVRYCSVAGGMETLPLEMVAHEFRLRLECGDSPTIGEYVRRFPHLSQSLSTLLAESLTVTDFSQATIADETPTVVDPTQTPPLIPRQIMEGTQPMSAAAKPARRQESDSGKANFGQYEFLNEIARGAMGVVYRARHVTIDKIVALKMILAGDFASQLQIDQFLREAQNAGRLEHDNIVRIYDAGNIQGQYYIAMAYIEGQSLSDLVREKPLKAQRSAEIVELVARALHFAHIQPEPVYHRDIKPANILMDHSGRPYVTDFGIAKRVERDSGSEDGQDDIAGTPSYMPPEQTFGRDIGPWSDVYSTGALLYHLLTGKPPFLADSLMETIRQVRGAEPVPPSDLNPKVDPDLEAVCMKCLEKDRTKRYSSAEHLADDLRRFLNHEPTQARPISQFGRLAKWCYRSPVVAGLAFAIVVLLASVAVGAVFVAQEQANLAFDAKQSEALAKENEQKEIEQRKIANAKKKEAEEQRIVAEQQRTVAEEQRGIADVKKREAEEKRQEADEQRKIADAQRVIADQKKKEAEAKQKEADEQRMLAQAARERAEQNLQNAIETVNYILTASAGSGLKDVPGMEKFRKSVAQEALMRLDPILKANSNQKEAMEARAKVLVVLAKLFEITGESDKAEEQIQAAIEEYNRLNESVAEKNKYALDLIAAYRQWGDSLTDQGQIGHSVKKAEASAATKQLLTRALEKHELAIRCGNSTTESDDRKLALEMARTYQARSTTLGYLQDSEQAIQSLKQAISLLETLLKNVPDGHEKMIVNQQLGSCLHNLVSQEQLQLEQALPEKLNEWLTLLDRAKSIRKELYDENGQSTDFRVDLASTHYSRAGVLMWLASDDKAIAELAEAQELFTKLADEFRNTPIYEYRRISAIHLSAAIRAEQRQFSLAASLLEEADVAIRAYNRRFPKALQENLRLQVCEIATGVATQSASKDRTTAEKILTWLPKATQELTKANDATVESEAKKLEPQVRTLIEQLQKTASGKK